MLFSLGALLALVVVVARASNDVAVEEQEDSGSSVVDDVLDADLDVAQFQADPIDWSVEPAGPPVEFAVLVRNREKERKREREKERERERERDFVVFLWFDVTLTFVIHLLLFVCYCLFV
jgi:hypothetical protein